MTDNIHQTLNNAPQIAAPHLEVPHLAQQGANQGHSPQYPPHQPMPHSPQHQAQPQIFPGNQAQDPTQALLSQLHDVKTPTPITELPVAIGWWLVLALILVSIFTSWTLFTRNRAKNRFRKFGLAELNALQNDSFTDSKWLEEVLRVLKQTCFSASPHARSTLSRSFGIQLFNRLNSTLDKPVNLGNITEKLNSILYGQNETHGSPLTQEERLKIYAFAKEWIKTVNIEKLNQTLMPTVKAEQVHNTEGAIHASV